MSLQAAADQNDSLDAVSTGTIFHHHLHCRVRESIRELSGKEIFRHSAGKDHICFLIARLIGQSFVFVTNMLANDEYRSFPPPFPKKLTSDFSI